MQPSSDQALVKFLADLFRECGEAHHRAFRDRDGDDPEWPLWYADFLMERLTKRLKAKFTKSELVYLLVAADREQEFRAPGADWPGYYAKFFYDRYL
ncbi:MAG: hypothetical protein PVJ49_00790 [Acidobacteriota bacterium]|jgi:hypothetical protein